MRDKIVNNKNKHSNKINIRTSSIYYDLMSNMKILRMQKNIREKK